MLGLPAVPRRRRRIGRAPRPASSPSSCWTRGRTIRRGDGHALPGDRPAGGTAGPGRPRAGPAPCSLPDPDLHPLGRLRRCPTGSAATSVDIATRAGAARRPGGGPPPARRRARRPRRRPSGAAARSSIPALVAEFTRAGAGVLGGLPAESGWARAAGRRPGPAPARPTTSWTPCWRRWRTSSTSSRRSSPGTPAGSPTSPRRPPAAPATRRTRCATLRRAGLVHDLGRTGVPNTIWDKPGPLTGARTRACRAALLLHRSDAAARAGAGRRPAGRRADPRAARRVRLPPGAARGRHPGHGPAARRGRLLPRDGRAAPAPARAAARRRGRRAARRGPRRSARPGGRRGGAGRGRAPQPASRRADRPG